MTAVLEDLEVLEKRVNAVSNELATVAKLVQEICDDLEPGPAKISEFTFHIRESWFKIPPGLRSQAVRISARLVEFTEQVENIQRLTEGLLRPAEAALLASRVEFFAKASREVADLIASYLERERSAKDLAVETPEETFAVNDALLGGIGSLPGRTYTAEEFKQRFG
jgi:hypothetical protein